MGPENTTDLSNAKPKLVAEEAQPGVLKVGFYKSISDGVMLHSKRGAETAFKMLSCDTQSPYIENHLKLSPDPETREYHAQHCHHDDPIGQCSKVLVTGQSRQRFLL